MSTATATAPGTFASSYASTRLTFPRILRSEWRKLWSLRSTWWALGVTVVIMVGFALAFSAAITGLVAQDPDAAEGIAAAGGLTPTTFVTAGYTFGALVAGTLGAMAMTGEYSTGQIRSTFSAVPRRLPVVWAKLLVIGVVTFVVIALSTAVAYAVTYPILDAHDMTVDLGDAEQWRSLVGTPLYVTVVAIFALAVGAILRSTPGTIVVVVALFFLVPGIIGGIAGATGADWAEQINKWLPSAAGERVITAADGAGQSGPPLFDAWPGFALLCGYTIALLAVAAVMVKRRDA